MPGWHNEVKDLVKSGKLVVLGVTQEQHAERCQLFAQWQQFTWPILHDSINALRSTAVPIVVAIDEWGVVQSRRPTADWVRTQFVTRSFTRPESSGSKAELPNIKKLKQDASLAPSAETFRALGDACVLWKQDATLAVKAYQNSLTHSDDAITHFRLGVAYRMQYESSRGRPADFTAAAQHWQQALDRDPNQYIWRRRIQQYGPRLDKPYPFYDWVSIATSEIKARSESPVRLKIPLSGAEIARPQKQFASTPDAANPDPTNRITRDQGVFVSLEPTLVPSRVESGQNIRLHLQLRPGITADWNNESEPVTAWIDTQPGWTPEKSLVRHAGNPEVAESREPRTLELELKAENPKQPIRGYVLYYVCEKSTGTCVLRRQDFSIGVAATSKR